jgi:uncharacterized protein (DUF927 family)
MPDTHSPLDPPAQPKPPIPDGLKKDTKRRATGKQVNGADTGATSSPGPFEVNEKGVYYLGRDRDGNPKKMWLCSLLDIVARTRDDRGRGWGRLLRWIDSDGVTHMWSMPVGSLYGDAAAVLSELADCGLDVATERAAREPLMKYIRSSPCTRRARCVSRLGWHGAVYVTPTEIIGQQEEQSELVVFQNAHVIEPAFSTAGTSKDWRNHVAALASGNSRMMFALCVAFAGPMLEPAGAESGGFHLRGVSSTGKSTALKLGASVYGNPQRYCHLWRATANGLEGIAAIHNDGVLILDELGQVNAHEAGESAYMLANGLGKARAARDGTARRAAEWRLIFLSAGEESLSAMMAQVGRKPTAGQEIRLADFDADAGANMGAFEVLHGHLTPKALAAALKDGADCYYGSVGADWLRWLVQERSKLVTVISNGVRNFVEDYAEAEGGQVERVARRFGLVAIAGELATQAGMTGWKPGDALTAVEKCFRSWLESFGGGTTNREARALLAQVKGFFEAHGASRFEDVNATDNQRINNRAGFHRVLNGRREFLVLPQVFKTEVCKGFDLRFATKVLRQHDWLIPGSDGRNQQKPRIPAIDGTAWTYVISEELWEYADGATSGSEE